MSRKFRWTCEADFPFGKMKPMYVKVNARPNMNIKETEKDFLNGKMWIPGKQEWQEISTTYFDTKLEEINDLYKIIAGVYDFTDSNPKQPPSDEELKKKGGTIKLTLLIPDYTCPRCGLSTWGMGLQCSRLKPIEEWTLTECWPTKVNFGELDYSSSDDVTIEVTWRYKNAVYKNLWETIPVENQANCKADKEVPVKDMTLGKMGVTKCCECQKKLEQPTTI